MLDRTKILWAVGGVGLIGFLFLLWWGCSTIVDLSGQVADLTTRLESTKIALDSEISRSAAVETALVRLEKQDYERRSQLRGFEGRLSQMSQHNEETRALLHTVIPVDLLRGLRVFEGRNSHKSD